MTDGREHGIALNRSSICEVTSEDGGISIIDSSFSLQPSFEWLSSFDEFLHPSCGSG